MKKEKKKIVVQLPEGVQAVRVDVVDGGSKVEIYTALQSVQTTKSNPVKEELIVGSKKYLDMYFPVLKLSKLSVDDDILKYEPKTGDQKKFKQRLIQAIESGLKDIRVQRMDPSLGPYRNIYYRIGNNPGVGRTPEWWEENAKKFCPEHNSRLGTVDERIAFMGLIIKMLTEQLEWKLADAWRAVCDQSKELGKYSDTEDSKPECECTGTMPIGNRYNHWFDLANTMKITQSSDGKKIFLVGGHYNVCGTKLPLANVLEETRPDVVTIYGVGWIVLDV